MKKFFSALTALLLSICFISCMADEISDSANSQKEVPCVLSLQNARTISPADGISYKDVQVWTVTFKDKSGKYNDIVKPVQFTDANPTYTVQLPLGEFYVIFEGTAESSTSGETASTLRIPFYGESTVTVTAEKANVSVFVAPQKKGKGSFNFTVNIRGLEQYPDPGFEAKLIKYPQDETAFPLVSFFDSNTYRLSVTGNNIQSGFYILSIKYKGTSESPLTEPKEIYSLYHDFLVEIVDNCETSGSADITVSLADSKTYYATTGETKGNGAFESLPKNLDELLDDIKNTTISKADIYDIYMVDKIDLQNQSYPEIDVSKVNEKGKTYNISTIGNEAFPCYMIQGAGEGDNPTIYTGFNVNTVNTINLNSSVPGKTVNVMSSYEVKELHLVLKNSTSVAIGFQVPVILDNIDSFEYYLENPFMTTAYETSVSLSSTLGESYTIVYKPISDTETGYYIVPASSANPSINGINFSLKAEKNGAEITTGTELYAGDKVLIKATPADGDTFAQGTTFKWFVNGKQVEANKDNPQSCSIEIGVTGDSGVNNSIICLVGYGTGYATAKIELNNVTDKTRTLVLYNNTLDTSDTTKPALSYATLTGGSISSSELLAKDRSTQIEDFCFDALNNMYAIVYDGSAYSINKYDYNDGYSKESVTTYTCSDSNININYLEVTDTDDFYAVIYNPYAEDEIYEYIAKANFAENGTVSFDKYTLTQYVDTAATSYSIPTFCLNNGKLYAILELKKEVENKTEYTIAIASCNIDDNAKTVATYKHEILSSTVENSNYSFNNYGNTLEYRDLCYIENTEGTSGTLYLLVRDVICSAYSDVLSSRGALCTFTVSDSGIQQGKIDRGYQKNLSYVSYTGSYDYNQNSYPTITRATYFGDGSSTFYGPIKFVAKKEDELIIADDGYSVTEEDYGSAGHKQGTVSSKNAVVTYNLNDETLKFTSLDGEYFENKYSGYFYSSSFYE